MELNITKQTVNKNKLRLTPKLIHIIWGGLIIFFLFVFIPIKSIGYSGGEQVPLTLLADAVQWIIWGYFLISIITTMAFFEWFKKYWIINVLIFIITGVILFMYLLS